MSADPSRPRLTSYDTDGNRTELSGTALLNWSSKVAGLLVDELGGVLGDLVVIRLRPGWQSAGILIGALWAGMTVTDADDASAIAAFVDDGSDAASDEVFVVSGHPLGAPSRQVAPHQRDYTGAVLGQADRFSSRWAASAENEASVGTAGSVPVTEFDRQLRDQNPELANSRLLTVGSWTLPRSAEQGAGGLISRLLGPLAAGASVIYCADWPDDTADASPDGTALAPFARRAVSEGATHSRGLDLPGLIPLR